MIQASGLSLSSGVPGLSPDRLKSQDLAESSFKVATTKITCYKVYTSLSAFFSVAGLLRLRRIVKPDFDFIHDKTHQKSGFLNNLPSDRYYR